jgi:hypothetical protein
MGGRFSSGRNPAHENDCKPNNKPAVGNARISTHCCQLQDKNSGDISRGTEEDRVPKKIFTQELEGSRRRGRPRERWKEEVERDLQVLGVRRWRELVADRENGRTLFDRPKPTVGCGASGRRRRGRKEEEEKEEEEKKEKRKA